MNNKISKAYDSLYKLCRICLAVIAGIGAISILFANFLYTTSVSYNAKEIVSISNVWSQSIILILVLALVIILACLLNRQILKIDEKKLFAFLSVLYIIAGLYLILNVDNSIRADAYLTHNSAKNYMLGDFQDFGTGGYISRYPQQIGLVCLDYILLKISANFRVNFFFNLALVIGINYLTYLIANEIFKDKRTNLFTIVISFAFLPQLFYILFAYGLIPGLFMMIIAFYFAIKFGKNPKLKYAIIVVIAGALAYFLKSNYLIGCLSIAIYMIICTLKEKKIKYLAVGLAVIICMSLPTTIATNYFENKTNTNLDNGTPTILWLAMGTDIDNNQRAPGWYNYYNWNTYDDCGYNSAKANEIGIEKLKDNIEKIKSNKKEAFNFFREKDITQWTDPLYQSVWSGPLKECKQYTHTDLLNSIYNGELREQQLNIICKFVTLTIWIFATAFIILKSKEKMGWELFFTYFVGGLLFHTIWEAKSQYIYTYVFSLIPFSAYVISQLINKLTSLTRRNKDE